MRPFHLALLLLCGAGLVRAGTSEEAQITGGSCLPDHFSCDDGACIPQYWRCDGHRDCADGSDEPFECLQNQTCRPEQFQCALTRKCLPNGWVCDDEPDCGTSPQFGVDASDEDPRQCHKEIECAWNQAKCGDGLECVPLKSFCDGKRDCSNDGDEWDFCNNSTACKSLECSYGCKPTVDGPLCFCPDGQRADGNKCVDANECELDNTCAQLCSNTDGSFTCSCVSGYKKNGTNCIAVNVPADKPASLIFSTQSEIRRVTLDGKEWGGNSTLKLLNSNALEILFNNRSICYVHHNLTRSSLVCANVDNFEERHELSAKSTLLDVNSVQQMAVDWVSGNWYFLDDQREIVLICTQDLDWCNILIEKDLSKPKALALDPTRGFMFFTKWGHSPPMLERCKLDGTERKAIVDHKIVYPYGVTIDFPTEQIYWIDTYLDFVEKVDYDGRNRRTLMRGVKVRNLYGISVFEDWLFASSWYNNDILSLHKFDNSDRTIVKNISRPFNVYVYHRQRQPVVAQPCKSSRECDHLCVPKWNGVIAMKKCICAAGYRLNSDNKCVIVTPKEFLIVAKSKPASIKGLEVDGKAETFLPITGLEQPTAVDYDAKTRTLFYSDVQQMIIVSVEISNTNVKTILKKDVKRCDGLAIDWMSRNLYWTDQETGSVSVLRLSNSSQSKTIVQDVYHSPLSIALEPKRGVMYWADWSNLSPHDGVIHSAHMDGSNLKVFLKNGTHWPSGLTLDLLGQRLYWCDRHLRRIESVDYNGENRRVELSDGLDHPFGFALGFDKTLYFTEFGKGTVMSYNNRSGLKLLDQSNPPLFDLKLFDARLQEGTNVCSIKNPPCPELCLPTPGGAVCACSDGYKFVNSSCEKRSNYTVTDQICPSDHFQCHSRKHCVPLQFVCDEIDNCGDGSDELAAPRGPCGLVVCDNNQFKCDNSTCMARHWVCDGEKDCLDGTDEDPKLCSKVCSTTQFKCETSKRCIPLLWKCDGINDCGPADYSDEVDCDRTCELTEFTCKNGRCISSNLYCDGNDDCTDGSDEVECIICNPRNETFCLPLRSCLSNELLCDTHLDCPDMTDEVNCKTFDCPPETRDPRCRINSTCEANEFRCKNGECIRNTFFCDGDRDCLDGSDELCNKTSSTKRPKVVPSTCDYPSRSCDNNTKCVSVDRLCDDRDDCADGSDEGLRCAEKLCDHSFVCSHNCHDAPEGVICYCPPHLHLQADRTSCLDTHPCAAWGVCSQTCVPRASRFKCTCLPGYAIEEDGFTCKSNDSATPYVIFSNRHELKGVDLHTFGVKSFINSLKNTIALDFYHTDDGGDMVFWTDVIDDKIYRGTVIGGSLSNIEVVVQTGLSTAEGLAVDWIGGNLYWVESNLDQIEVAKLNGSFRRTLVAGDMESPRAVALDPRDGWLFWTDWDNNAPRIERCSLAGLDREVVVQVDKISDGGWPNGLTLDYDSRRIYWIDARSDSIHTTKYDGSDHHEVMRNHEMLSHPFAIALFENYVYWTDWRTNSVVRANKWTGGDVSIIQRTLTQPFDIQILHPSRQPTDGVNPCGDNNGGCSHLCLLHTNRTFKCDCPHVMRLSENNKTCVVNERVLLIARPSEIRGVDLLQPYYHTIPTISVPQVLSPIQLEYLARNNTLYWADQHISEIKRSGLTLGPTQTLIDTGLQHPTGLAVDWLSNLMFVSSPTGMTISNLDAEFSTTFLEGVNVQSVAVNPREGRVYWISRSGGEEGATFDIESSSMDGSNRKTLISGLKSSKSLSVDLRSSRLYWVQEFEIYFSDLEGNKVTKLELPSKVTVAAATVYRDLIYYADDDEQSVHSVDKTSGLNDTILRNGTGSVLSLRIYDPLEQKGTHPCSNATCQHLCLPKSRTQFSCRCATGYMTDPKWPEKCVGTDEFLFYSISWEIRGLPMTDVVNGSKVLGPISRVSMATAIDFVYDQDLLIWADSDHGSITSIKRDGTERRFIIEPTEALDSVPVDWLTGLAVDWIAGNLYWCDSKRGVIEVSRLDGSKQHALLFNEIGKPTSIVVDPVRGFLVWAGGPRIEIAYLDGRNRTLIVNNAQSISDVTLDSENEMIYFCDSKSKTLEVVKYDGSDRNVLLNHSLGFPVGLTVLDETIYWIDTTVDKGSVIRAPLSNVSDFKVLLRDVGDSLKDIQIFSKRKQGGTNPCAKNNGGCEQLCLFNSTHPVCVCSHGRISSDGRSCEAFESFVMYSRVISIDSIQMKDDENLQNAPHSSIKNNTILKNAIGLSFSYKHSRLFYSDIQKGSINAVFFNGSDHKIIVEGQGSVQGLAYEQIQKALYWTCSNHATINRVNLTDVMTNASRVEEIVRLRSQDKPRGIAVDSCESQVFWTNWNTHQPTIERAFLSGYGRQVIVQTDIRIPNALALDHKAQKLYWGDARLDKIERCEFDGSNRVVLAKVTPQHPFALAVYEDYIYWTDWMLHAVLRADKLTGQNVVWLRRDISRPMGIVAIANDTEDCFSNPCKVLKGGCEDYCKLNASGAVQCYCFDGRVLAEDGRRCFSKPTTCSSVDGTFRCSDGGCVPFDLTCDGIPHCSDRSDEEPGYCGHRTCPIGWFQCINKRCVPLTAKCNSEDDCGDGSDEEDCTCSDDQFRCANGKCISKAFRCDFDPDCEDASDEIGCEVRNCSTRLQDVSLINCPNTTACIHKEWFCDNENDCWDMSDERNCTGLEKKCHKYEFRCSNGNCVSASARCDGKDDCGDSATPAGLSSDEENCNNGCESDQFMCEDDHTCIALTFRCNGIANCFDHSDERNCRHHCKSDQFKCANGECIPISWQCDGHPDCLDQTDESKHCQQRTCSEGEFRCNSTGRCIPLTWVCDGEADCTDEADEHKDQGCGACLPEHFQCLNGLCINKMYYCDGDKDCFDGSDEVPNCHKECLPGEWSCRNGKCIMNLHKCDGHDDCGDNSDEEDCQNEGGRYCTSKDWYLCNNGVCINATLICNGENNCGDHSDEEKCNIDECATTPSPCAHDCRDLPIGYKCHCKPGYKVSHKEAHLCEDIDECATQRPCSQLCRNTRGSYVCTCADGYKLTKDGQSCGAVSEIPATLLLANRYYIRELDLEGHSTLIAHNLTNAVALDYDWATKCIYWSDVTQLGSSIKRLCDYKNNSSAVQILHAPTLQNPDGLAVDWIGRNLYWCDKGLDTLEVSSLDGRFRKVLLFTGLEEPRAIALDPIKRFMYWTDWGSHVHIGKAGMDGSNPHVIVNDSLGWPNALTISFETNELFWADAKEDYIAVADLDGNDRFIIASRERTFTLQLHHVFAIDIWEDEIFWTDWETKTIERCHKYRGDNCTSLLATVHRPMDIRVVHPLKQPTVENPCAKANCSALCLLAPGEPGYTCACPENYIPSADGGKQCKANCTSAHFECTTTYKCIPFWWKCDTQDDCGDGSDEPDDCPAFKCMPGQYQCANGHCTHPSELCNGVDDCGDGSDEKECDKYTCLNTQFSCQGNASYTPRCIPSKLRCNRQADCPLGEDELDCPPATCPPNQFKCDNDKCIPAVWVCDTDNDCGDNSDERDNCADRSCSLQHYRCASGRCIPMSWVCDGDPDCVNSEDEPETCSHPEFHTCEPTYFRCKNNKCIPGRWKCDYDNDCGDGSDEIDCVPRNCSESEFRCGDGRCIRGTQKCDGEFHCEDKSDEKDCKTQCKANEFQCTSPQICIYLEWRCDGDADCPDGSDEENCSEICPHNGFKCKNGLCINEEWRCDGQNDCDDGYDELDCALVGCLPDRFRCKNDKCIPTSQVCDGVENCDDGSDEGSQLCRNQKTCPPDQFRCQSGHCIGTKLKCDGKTDCANGEDEADCNDSICLWNSCAQICVEEKHKNSSTCKCLGGFSRSNKGKTCTARGDTAHLILASEAELKLISPYNHKKRSKTLMTAPGYKVDAVDILWGKEKSVAFWSDHQNNRIQSMTVDVSQPDFEAMALTREGGGNSDHVKTILSGLQGPKGLAVDWVAKRLYITDSSRIIVSSLDGQTRFTLIQASLQQPRDIVVAPDDKLMFWTDWGPAPRIEGAYMDGFQRSVIASKNVLWPTGLAIDYTTKRLYWSDPKTMTVETVLFDGSDRHIVKRFDKDQKPYKIEIFENFLFVSTYMKHDVLRLDKFGSGNVTILAQGLARISDILILQEQKQPFINNSCQDYCHPTEFCLLNPYGASCNCADGYTKDNLTCKAISTKTADCPLNCNTGTCKIVQGQQPKCFCRPQYTGQFCEHYRCSQYCKNKGMCYVDLAAAKSPDSPAPLRCNCPPQWTGDICQTPVNLCAGRCFNGGTCYVPKPGLPQCNCRAGFTGSRCQNCVRLTCENGGVCVADGQRETCRCPVGYKGHNCEDSVCGEHGSPVVIPNGIRCSCMPGYSGDICERNECFQHCHNGGTCRIGTKQPECACPVFYSGRRCEIDLCTSSAINNQPAGCKDRCSCKNNGTCIMVSGVPVCKCPDKWGGNNCEVYVGKSNACNDLCQNGGVCQIMSAIKAPICRCPDSWAGHYCDEPAVCEGHCQNNGECSVTDGIAYCRCPKSYHGNRCEIYRPIEDEEVDDKVEEVGEPKDGASSSTRSILVPVISAAVVIVIILALFVLFDHYFRRRQTFSFSHERLQENDFNNPMYQDRDAEPFTLDADKSGNFANPVYDSVYSGSGSGGREEKAVLLQHPADDTAPPATEEI